MWGVTGVENIQWIAHNNRIVAIFLATGLDISALKWLVDAWEPLHYESGMDWHLVAPTRKAINSDAKLATLENYDHRLAKDWARLFGITDRDLPCVVLDSFNDEIKQLQISLPESERERRHLFEDITDFANKSRNAEKLANWRESLNQDLYYHLQSRRLMRDFVKFAPKLGSAALKHSGKLLGG